MPYIHPTATVEDGATLGAGTKIWHHGQVRSNARVGTDCSFGKNVFIDTGVHVGNGVRIQNNVSVYAGVTIEDDVFVGPSAVFTNDLYPRAGNPGFEIVPTLVRHGATIGANATIICGIEIGRFATVAAGSTVTRSVADHQLVMGVPARPAGWVCACGQVVTRSVEPPDTLTCPQCEGNHQ